jgi:hypothetical protein
LLPKDAARLKAILHPETPTGEHTGENGGEHTGEHGPRSPVHYCTRSPNQSSPKESSHQSSLDKDALTDDFSGKTDPTCPALSVNDLSQAFTSIRNVAFGNNSKKPALTKALAEHGELVLTAVKEFARDDRHNWTEIRNPAAVFISQMSDYMNVAKSVEPESEVVTAMQDQVKRQAAREKIEINQQIEEKHAVEEKVLANTESWF